ncbi:hypothetical protein HJG60_009639 [Phyllostomus discolor]|uniref:Uncharacterized protein n=1 Tax=Phyllostomus discolor TaxID=89673 RepID=A0A834B2X6_9CHIR|nr:hypothetical protein HJG60_009639 [Phyllostomus discolor]
MLTDGTQLGASQGRGPAARKLATLADLPAPGPEKPSPHHTLPADCAAATAPRFRQPRDWGPAGRKSRLRERGARRGQALGGRADTAPARPPPALPACSRLLAGRTAGTTRRAAGDPGRYLLLSVLPCELDPGFRRSHQ